MTNKLNEINRQIKWTENQTCNIKDLGHPLIKFFPKNLKTKFTVFIIFFD